MPFTPTGLPWYGYSNLTLDMIDTQSGVLYSPTDLTAYATATAATTGRPSCPSPALAQTCNCYRATGLVGNGVLWQSSGNHVSLSTDRGQTWHDATVHAEDAAAPNCPCRQRRSSRIHRRERLRRGHQPSLLRHGATAARPSGRCSAPTAATSARTAAAGAVHATSINGKFLTSNGALLSTGRRWPHMDAPGLSDHHHPQRRRAAFQCLPTDGWLVLGGKLGAFHRWRRDLVDTADQFRRWSPCRA